MFVFNGTRTAPTKSYVLVFDQTTQKATLERLDSTYTFNLATKNNLDVSSQQAKIYPKRQKDSVHDKDSGEEDLFGDEREGADEGTEPDPSNPYDFRHFLNAVKTKKTDEADKEYASSPDYRSNTGTGTANTPVPAARRAAEPPKKRKAASVFAATKPTPKKPGAKPSAKPTPNTPAIHLERRASDRPTPSTTTTSKKPAPTAAAPSTTSTKIKSAEFIHDSSSDEIDFETSGPSPSASADADADSDTRSQTHLPINMHISHARSPSNGPISLASAATSVEGSPAPRRLDEEMEIDFGDLGGDEDADGDAEGEEDEDGDLDMDAEGEEDGEGEGEREVVRKIVNADANANGIGMAVEVDEGEGEDEDDPLFQEMMEGLAGGDSSEESEEE